MPDRRRRPTRTVPPERRSDPRYEAGQRLKRAIHVARASKGMTSDMQLSVGSGVSYDTLYNWYSGRTTPRGAELRKMALFLGVPFSKLQAVYDGVEPEPLPLQDAVRDLVRSLDDLVAELRLTRAEQVVVVEQMEEALRLAGGLSRAPTSPTRPRRPVGER